MKSYNEIRKMTRTAQIANSADDLPAILVLKRGTIRTLTDGKRIAEYSHESSGVTLVYPMMFHNRGNH